MNKLKSLMFICIIAVMIGAFVKTTYSGGPQIAPGNQTNGNHPLPEMLQQDPPPNQSTIKYVPGEILVKLKKDAPAVQSLEMVNQAGGLSMLSTSSFDSLLQQFGIESAQSVFQQRENQNNMQATDITEGEVEFAKPYKRAATRGDLSRWYHLKLPVDTDIEQAVATFKADVEVETAEL